MVRALERLALAAARRNLVATVPADVDESAQLSVAAADDEDRDVAGATREVGAGLGDGLGRAGVLPAPAEDALLLEPVDLGVGVPAGGKREALVELLAEIGRDDGHHCLSIARPPGAVRVFRAMSLRLTPDQRAVLDRLERGEIDADEAERLLTGAVAEPAAEDAMPVPDLEETRVAETDEEAKARELVERLARDIYGDEEPSR